MSEEIQQTEQTVEMQDVKPVSKFDKFFGITANGSSVSTEIFAGITTFLAMAYILTVNPSQIIGAPSNSLWSSIFLATALGAVVGTLLMALFAKMPLAQAPGMGLNAAIGGLIGGWTYGMQFPFGTAMLIVLISGILFFLLTVIPCGKDKETGRLIGIREKIFESIPAGIRVAIPVGIGLFIAYIGMQNAGLIKANQYTQVELVDFTNWETCKTAVVSLVSLLAIAILSHFKVKGAVIIGIVIATLFAMPIGVANFDIIAGKTDGVTWAFWKNFANFFSFDADKGGSFFAAFQT